MKRKWISMLIMAGLVMNNSLYAQEALESVKTETAAVAQSEVEQVATQSSTEAVINMQGEAAQDNSDTTINETVNNNNLDHTVTSDSTEGSDIHTPIEDQTDSSVVNKGNQVVLTLNTTTALVNGEEMSLLSPPTVIQNTTLLPLRFVANQVVGAQVDWNSETQTVTITKNGTVVTVTVGSKLATIDGLEVELEVAPIIQDGVTLLPVRFISETFDIKVEFDNITKVITLTEKVPVIVPGEEEKPNEKPVASFSFPQTYTAGQVVSATNTSTDPDGDTIVDQLWSVVAEKTVTNKNLSNIFKTPRAGTYVIGLQVQDSRGLWSDWTYETITIEENKPPVITGLTAKKSNYAQGEKLEFSYTYDNETWETVKEGKWTYRSSSESPNRATLGKPDVLFTEGDYIITLYLDDAYGNRSEGVETRVHITSEVKMSEIAYRFTEGKIGGWIDNFQNTNYLNYKDVTVVDKTAVPGTLIMSDSPEMVKGEGILYQDKMQGNGRLLIHHVSEIPDAGKKQRLAVIMRNDTTQPITVTLTNKVFKGPVADTLRAGQVALEAYYKGVPPEIITLEPGESKYMYEKNWLYGQCITGHVDVQATGEVTFVVAALNSDQDLNSLNQLIYYPADGSHFSGTYDKVAFNYNIVLNGNEPEKLNLGIANSGEWVTGYDQRDMSYVENAGNFGVSYYLTVTATEDTGVILNNRGGTFKGAIKWNNDVYNMPLEGTFSGTTTKAVTVGIIKKGETVTLEYMLPNGSAAPTLIGFIPKSCW